MQRTAYLSKSKQFLLLAAVLIAAFAVAMTAAAPAHAATSKEYKGLLYYSAVKGGVHVMPKAKTKSVVVPAKIGKKKVVSLGAYSECKKLKKLNLKKAKYLQNVDIRETPKLTAVDLSKCPDLKEVKVCENAKVDIPDAMIEDQIDSMLRDMEMRMMYQGMKLDDYFKYTGQTREQVREMYKPQAEERVLSQLVIEAVKKAENIEATDEEIDAEIAKYAEQSKMELDKFKENLSDSDREYFADAATARKTIDFLKANAE